MSENKPEFITFTGVDAQTDPAAMVRLVNDYPGRIEWGVLFSPKRQGLEPRYPLLHFITELVREVPMVYAAHLCGGDARAVIEHGESPHDELLGAFFARAQINTADPKVQPSLIKSWADTLPLRAILQCRGEFPDVKAVDVLFDASGGRGISPGSWPKPAPGRINGYAGGLNPDNVANSVQKISARFMHSCSGATYWIDMESGVRDEQDRFDVAKCRAVCEAVYGGAP